MEATYPTFPRRVGRGAIIVLFWIAAAVLVLGAHLQLDPTSPIAAAITKVVAIVGAGFAYMRLATRGATLDHALFVGVAWLALGITCEITVAMVAGHGWFEIIGAPSAPAVRNLLMITWIAAPAIFARHRS